SHRAHWGYQVYDFGCGMSSCAGADRGVGGLPTAGRWVALTVNLSSDVAMGGHELTGVAFGAFGEYATIWWGPTLLQFPGTAVTDPTRASSTFTYDQYNDAIASVDPNGIATVTDYNAAGQVLQSAGGVQPLSAHTISYNVGTWTFESNGNAGATNPSSLVENHNAAGLQSDLYQDFSPTL